MTKTDCVRDPPRLVDYGHVPEFYCDGLGRIEHLGDNVMFKPFCFQRPLGDEDGQFERVINLKVTMPFRSLPDISRQLIESFGPYHAVRSTQRAHREAS